ncbi:MAG TPA: alpha/beta fold hydrolase [Rhodocyclaceae bacterium]|jgi:predicted alpha/beta hydrolase|nr:alpha/beta fold hydrolase [Betaproteobacteria bacterium]HMV00565.1 alpha/beta fold hydrolase [Rhodocyclaceae bacterium]HMV20833.1 alpha/beta fold hydrolase [Rhodocyclaceae bacterium]HNE42691.1 alpha/beta fold hydrolase [Rhodocyclaceae bacterium]HNM20977.1 alpha/beta fold hydrolase [Rhodocyclaceae bacterium]
MDRLHLDQAAVATVCLTANDGVELVGHLWLPTAVEQIGTLVVNPATAVKAGYYHRFARYLARQGYAVLTYDYRSIGASRQRHPRATRGIDKYAWGAYDCDAALRWARQAFPDLPLDVVAHSIGGLLVGLAAHGKHVRRCLTVGAQYAYWPDYAADRRRWMWLRWHVLMPLVTAILGYFPARRLGWHEDIPAGVAYEWAFRTARLEDSYAHLLRRGDDPLRHFPAMTGEILAIGLSDDPFGTPAALDRLLGYYCGAKRTRIEIRPGAVGAGAIGHFAYFHDRFEATLWADALRWLRDGALPPRALVYPFPASENDGGTGHDCAQ